MYGCVLLSVMRFARDSHDPGTIAKVQGFGISSLKIRGFTVGIKARLTVALSLEMADRNRTSMLVYLVMAVDFPPWALKAIDKIRRGFLWKGRKDVIGGHCAIAWPKVTQPSELGGLGISNLQQLGCGCKMVVAAKNRT
jgi:hypothetical protein